MWEIADPVFLPLQLLLLAILAFVPGVLLAAVALAGRSVHVAEFLGLSLVLGLVAAPLPAFLAVAFSGHPLSLPFLLVPSLVVVAVCGPLVLRGRRPQHIENDRWLWAGLLSVALAIFLTHDPSQMLTALFRWAYDAGGNCFSQGTFQYLGVPTKALLRPMPPAGMAWDGVMRGNIALSSLFVYCAGMPGFRLLRVVAALLLALSGYVLGLHFTGRRAGAWIGLVVFALNPYAVMVQETDRNVLALAFAGFLFVAQVRKLLPFWAMGVLAGFVTGLGLQLLPVVYLIPLSIFYLLDTPQSWKRALAVLVIGCVASSIWLLGIGPYNPTAMAPVVHTYQLGPFAFQTNYVLGFPFVDKLYSVLGGRYPAPITFALHVLDTFGLALAAVGLVGWLRTWQCFRSAHHLLLLFGLPVFLVLSLMVEMKEDQLRLIIPALLPLLVFITVGADWLLQRNVSWRLRAGGVAAAALVVFGMATIAGHSVFPPPAPSGMMPMSVSHAPGMLPYGGPGPGSTWDTPASMSGAGDTQPNEHPGPGPIGEFPAGGADAPLELFEGDPLLPYLAPQALDRRLTGRFGDRALLGHAPNCQTALRLMCRDYRFPAILPDFVTPHPLLRPDNLVSGRMLDYAMADPTGYTELEAWKGLVQDVLSSHPGPGNPP